MEKLVSTDSISVYDFAVEVRFLANHTVSQRQGKGGLDCGLLIYGKTDNKNVQLVLQLFLQNEWESDVERFTTHVQTCLATNQIVASCLNADIWLVKIAQESFT